MMLLTFNCIKVLNQGTMDAEESSEQFTDRISRMSRKFVAMVSTSSNVPPSDTSCEDGIRLTERSSVPITGETINDEV